MKRIIGGLLVVSLLSKPNFVCVSALAYDIFTEDNKLVCVIKKEPEEINAGIVIAEINETLKEIQNNSKIINELLIEKNKIMCKIDTSLNLMRYAKKTLNDEQIKTYKTFMEKYYSETEAIKKSLEAIDKKKNLNAVKNEVLHNNICDYAIAYDELKAMKDCQDDVILRLESVIENGVSIFQTLEI